MSTPKRMRFDIPPVQPALLSLPADVWELVCALVADNPSWLFAVWFGVCKDAKINGCPASFPALRIRSDGAQVPAAQWQEWKEITCLTIRGNGAAPILRLIRENKTIVQTILIDRVTDQDLKKAADIASLRGLGSIHEKYSNCNEGPVFVPCNTWLSSCSAATDEALVAYLKVKKPRTLDLSHRRDEPSAGLCTALQQRTELRRLDLSFSGVSSLSWLATLKKLRYLSLDSCEALTDSSFAHLSGLSELRYLILDDCIGVAGSALENLSRLHNLKHLSLLSCADVPMTELTKLSRLQHLEYLNLTFLRQVTDLEFVTGTPKLRELILCRCNVNDDALRYLRNLQDLRVLDLSGNKNITSAGLTDVARLKRLRELDLGSCHRITSAGLQHLSGLKLQKLSLADCAIDEFKSLSEFHALQDLSLGGPELTGDELAHLPRNLQRLTLEGGPRFDGEKLRRLSRVPDLQQLVVKDCTNLASIVHLRALPNLRGLRFTNCPGLTNDVFEHCLAMENLQKLNISRAGKISREAIEAFKRARPGCDFRCR